MTTTANRDETGPVEGAAADRVAAKLALLRDHVEIDQLISKLGRWLDGGEFEPPRDVMAEEIAIATEGGATAGIEPVAAQAARNHGAYRTQHVITDRLIAIDGSRATVTANSIVRFDPVAADAAAPFTLGGRYRFEAVRGEAGWRLTRIEIAAHWRDPADALERAAAARQLRERNTVV
ncbi:nuclear transport factor 2 family protein [Conexibacter arvalis]|uniref:SnoaL-like domain-containing protein n=1 Tax=Conexibacter arvalis TaxID=912552 RepID=A0A840IJB8_9ACTN|nr:nuclear transport factor 2 family protein [Conexibacter arvalis]MBB4664435.1 hypothetical protein [Conexibacter arvalis]